jgi:predicted RNA-binding protein
LTNWLIPVTEDNWEVIKRKNIYGAPENSAAPQLIKGGDNIIFYIIKKGSKRLGGKIVGVYRTISDWFKEGKPLWPDEVAESKVKYPWRIRVEPVKIGIVDLGEIAEKLSFTKRVRVLNVLLMGTPANAKKPISDEDLKVILEHLRSE